MVSLNPPLIDLLPNGAQVLFASPLQRLLPALYESSTILGRHAQASSAALVHLQEPCSRTLAAIMSAIAPPRARPRLIRT